MLQWEPNLSLDRFQAQPKWEISVDPTTLHFYEPYRLIECSIGKNPTGSACRRIVASFSFASVRKDSEMAETRSNKGPWIHRFLLNLFTVTLAVLIYWLLGFVINDIGSWPSSSYSDVENRLLDLELLKTSNNLEQQFAETKTKIEDEQVRQRLLSDSTANSQRTMNQLLENRRLSLQKDVTPSAEEQKALAESQQLFLSNQKQYQLLNEELARLNEQLRDLTKRQTENEQELTAGRLPVRREFESLQRRHDLKISVLKLSFLTPLLIVAIVLFLKKRGTIYVPLISAFGIALMLKVGVVMHEYFPTRYFKYVLIIAALLIVTWILVYLLRMVAFPQKEWLLKQYREAYETFFCPICNYPIRRGPLKFMFWSRRSIKKRSFPPSPLTDVDEPYTCPMCATKLFESCEQCDGIRHSLLPSCEKCGAQKVLTEATS